MKQEASRMKTTFKQIAAFAAATVLGTITAASGAEGSDVRLQGGGATFPNPLYQKWVAEFQKVHPDVKIDYQSIGSGRGVKDFTEETFDFAGSDTPLSKKEQEAAGGSANIVQVPSCPAPGLPACHPTG